MSLRKKFKQSRLNRLPCSGLGGQAALLGSNKHSFIDPQ
jgi:hypothetical protein